MTSALRTSRLAVGYQGQTRQVLKAGELELAEGRLVTLAGANGSGKSTLLRTLAGLQPALEGTLEISGQSTALWTPQDLAKVLSVVLTEPLATGAMRVEEVVALGRIPYLNWAGRTTKADRLALEEALEVAGVEPLRSRVFQELSDGERQRALIARALAQEPKVLLLDEPTAYLDPARRVEMAHLLYELAHEKRMAVLWATHELELAFGVTDELWLVVPTELATEKSLAELRCGAPEDLALSGDIERAFAGRPMGATFDLGTARFEVPRQRWGIAMVEAAYPKKVWAERALERSGLNVVLDQEREPGSESILRLRESQDGWVLTGHGDETHRANLAEVVELLLQWRRSSV